MVSVVLATALWVPALAHVIPTPSREDTGRGLIHHTLAVLDDPNERDKEIRSLRAVNPEWDLMWRTYTTLALADLAIDDPSMQRRSLVAMDRLIDDTLAREAKYGQHYFLLPYARRSRWVDRAARSVFVDGEILLSMAARQHVERDPSRDDEMRARQAAIVGAFERSPLVSAESYPDECWTYSDVVALAGLRAADPLLGTDHSRLAARWAASARAHFVTAPTGLLDSSHTLRGETRDWGEGSTLWMTVHALLLVDPALANEQWNLGRAALVERPLGFAYAREWPRNEPSRRDVDSGPVIPLIGAGPASSGLALVAARGVGDEELLRELTRSLELTALPVTRGNERWYAATGPMGHAVVTYGLGSGSLWARLRRGQS